MPHRDVKRLGGDVLLGQVRHIFFDTGRYRRHDRRVGEADVDEARQCIDERLRLLWRDVETKDLDRNQTVLRWVVRAKNRTENADPNLVHDAEGTECTWG